MSRISFTHRMTFADEPIAEFECRAEVYDDGRVTEIAVAHLLRSDVWVEIAGPLEKEIADAYMVEHRTEWLEAIEDARRGRYEADRALMREIRRG